MTAEVEGFISNLVAGVEIAEFDAQFTDFLHMSRSS